MAESIQGIKVSALPEATQTQLTDTSVTIVDDGTTTRKTKLSTFVEWLKGKIIKNTLTQASTGYALDAYQGKLLKDEVDELNSTLIDKIYPIGSIYMSVNNVSPETLFGGKWEIWGEGRVPVGVKTNDSSFDTPEKTGGSESIDLSHSHTVNKHNHTSGSMYAAIDATGTWIGVSRLGGKSYSCDVYSDIPVQGKSYTAKYGARIFGNTGEADPETNSQLPSSQSILNPYITCYMWKRTA